MPISPFYIYCQKILPAVYDDSLSYYESICRMVDKLNEVIEYANLSGPEMQKLQEQIDELKQELDEWKNGGFKDYIEDTILQWVNDNEDEIFNVFVRQVFFGLNLEGYFVAYVPKSWNDIVFDTGAVFGIDTYGRLILRWDADSPYSLEETVNQEREDYR